MKSSELFRMLISDGWYIVRTTGSHYIMAHGNKEGNVTVPYHSSMEVPKGLLHSILKQAAIKTDKDEKAKSNNDNP